MRKRGTTWHTKGVGKKVYMVENDLQSSENETLREVFSVRA